jgi:hypothetical protein
MDDGSKFPKTFDEWERKAKPSQAKPSQAKPSQAKPSQAKRQLASAAAAGVPIQPVILDPGEFLTYCKAKNFSARGDRERNVFARASAKDLNSKRAASVSGMTRL